MVTGLLGFARRHQRAALFPVLALLLANTSWSQPNPPQQDPYLTLMMAQPKLEADGPVDPVATFDPPAVRPGETSIYRVTLRALEETVQWPGKISAPEQLQLSPGARGQIFQMGRPGTMVAVTVINTRVRATAEGEFTIPEFTLLINGKRITIPVAKLVVTNHPPAESPSFKLALSLEPREAFVGQSVAARIALEEPPGVFQPLQQPQLVGDGILVDQSAARQQMTVAPRAGGSNVMEYTYETVLTPIQTGALKLFAQGFLSPSHFPANAFLAGVGGLNEGPSPSLLETDTAQLMVNPLPDTGKLPGFTGAIGKLSMETPVLENDHVTAGEPVRLTARVETSPTLDRIIAPPPPVVRDWEIFAGSSNSPAPRLVQSRHYFTFDYILIPLSADSKETPAIPFSYFDPEEKKYRDLTIPSLPITVEPGAAAPNAAELVQSGPRGQNPEPELSLSGLALAPGKCVASLLPPQRNRWFLWSQCLPALVFFGLWRWD
ncbi:MAG TPA: BatD family protein, partial [Verrucomicrobiae bacterium]|nr:BatD family protein [Verrucomicrobiae bacterium]